MAFLVRRRVGEWIPVAHQDYRNYRGVWDFASDFGVGIVIHSAAPGRLTGGVPVVIALKKKCRQMPDLADWPEQLGTEL